MKGEGVVQTLTSISKMVLHKLQQTTGMDTEDGGPDKSMAASYRALRKEADRIGTEPHAPSPPPPPPPPPLVVEKVGTVRQNGERLLLPVQLQVHGESRIYRIELQLAVTGATPVATVERFDKEPT
jgi:hypothetical protein